uniref:Uncharacterized protein n=1 Tax=Tanacetum cinerariifolium TaxID=118510 RepID=A0A699GZD8_TANCI|nr:hypothetical protein [Tanacetum cinerariifolium]
MIKKQVGDLSTHTTKYTSPALTQKVFSNIRRVGKGFSGVKTPLFAGMLVEQQVAEEGDAEVHGEEVNASDTAEGDISDAHGEVPTIDEEPSIPSLTPLTPPPQPSHDIPSTSQKLDRRNKVKVLKLRRYQKVGTSQRVETSDETMMDDVYNQGRMIAEMDQDADVVLEDDKKVADDKEVADEDAKLITKVVIAASETITAASINITAVKAQVSAVTLTAAPARVATAPSRKRKGVVIRDPKEESTTSIIIRAETKSKDKGKGILAELNRNIDLDKAIDHVKQKAKEDPTVKRYQVLKRKPLTEAQARKNMMVYLNNVVGFKMYYFKGMSYDDICPIFEIYSDSNMAFLKKTKEHIEEEESRALRWLNETPVEKAAKRQKLDEEVEELKRHL